MRFLNLILILLMWTEAVFAVSTTDNNKVVGKTLKVASEYVTSMSKIDGSFESGNTGWVSSVGTITPTASTEFQGNYKGLWSATGTGTLDLQWTATASNTYEASAIVSVSGADSDHYVCAVVNGVETGCTLFDGPDYTPNKQIKVSVVADSVKGASFYLRIKHTGTDAFNLSIDDGKIQPWTAQTVQTVEQESVSYTGYSTGTNPVVFLTKDTQRSNEKNLIEVSTVGSAGTASKYKILKPSNFNVTATVYYLNSGGFFTSITHFDSAGSVKKRSILNPPAGSLSGVATISGMAEIGDYFTVSTNSTVSNVTDTFFSITASALRNNVVQAWQQPGDIGEIKYLPQNIAPNGFIPANGITIGNSGATYSGAQYLELYKVLWSIATTTSTDPYYISSAKGSSADADWAANKTIKIDESGLFTRAYKSGTSGEVGAKQNHALEWHYHPFTMDVGDVAYGSTGVGSSVSQFARGNGTPNGTLVKTGPTLAVGSPASTASETRPMNVAKYVFIRYAVSTPTLLALPNGVETDYYIEASGNGGQVLTSSDAIPFIATVQNNSNWNGTSFTAPTSGNYEIEGSVNFSSTNTGASIVAYVNNVETRRLGSALPTVYTIPFNGKIYLTAGQVLTLKPSSGGTLVNESVKHWLSITRLNGKIDKTFISNINPDGFNKTSGQVGLVESFSFSYGTTNATTVCSASPCSYLDQIGNNVTSVTRTSSGVYTANLSKTFTKLKCTMGGQLGASSSAVIPYTGMNCSNCNSVGWWTVTSAPVATDSYGTILCQGY